MDHSIGLVSLILSTSYDSKILSKLKQLQIENNTLVFFLSDNGPWSEQLLNGGSAGLFTGGKGSTWEGGIRGPAVVPTTLRVVHSIGMVARSRAIWNGEYGCSELNGYVCDDIGISRSSCSK